MRTTLTIEDDALELAKQLARRKRVSLGRAVSELVRRGGERLLPTSEKHGLAVIRLPAGTPPVSAEKVDELLDDLA